MSKEKIQEHIQTSDDDSGIPRQARLDSNPQTTLPTLESESEKRELLLVCVESEGTVLLSIYSAPRSVRGGRVCCKQQGRLM